MLNSQLAVWIGFAGAIEMFIGVAMAALNRPSMALVFVAIGVFCLGFAVAAIISD